MREIRFCIFMFPINVTVGAVRLGLTGLRKSPTQGNRTGLICCLVLMSLCTTAGTPACSGIQHTSNETGTPVLCLQSQSLQLTTAMYKHAQSDWEIPRKGALLVRTGLAAFFGTGDSSRISMMYRWHFCRSHILPLLSVRYCKTNSLKRNSGIPRCTYHKKRHRGISSLCTHHNFTESQNRWGWEGSLLKAGPCRTGCPGPHSVMFLMSPRLETLQLLRATVPEFNHLDGICVIYTIIRKHMLGKWLIEKQEL